MNVGHRLIFIFHGTKSMKCFIYICFCLDIDFGFTLDCGFNMDRKTFIAQCIHQHSKTFFMSSNCQPKVNFKEMEDIYLRLVEVLDELWGKIVETGVENPKQIFVSSIPVAMHNRWLKIMKDGGWEYSKTYNGMAKFHSDMVPFEKLCQFSKNRKLNECLVYLHSRWLWEQINNNEKK